MRRIRKVDEFAVYSQGLSMETANRLRYHEEPRYALVDDPALRFQVFSRS
jgi:hypothetical protein